MLRSPAQYAQWIEYGQSVAGWPERDAVTRIACPRMNVFGGDGDLVEAGIPVPIASRIRANRGALEALGWRVHEIPGHGHGLCMQPEIAVPPVRAFLDEVVR